MDARLGTIASELRIARGEIYDIREALVTGRCPRSALSGGSALAVWHHIQIEQLPSPPSIDNENPGEDSTAGENLDSFINSVDPAEYRASLYHMSGLHVMREMGRLRVNRHQSRSLPLTSLGSIPGPRGGVVRTVVFLLLLLS